MELERMEARDLEVVKKYEEGNNGSFKSVGFSDARCFSIWGNNDVGWIHNEGLIGVVEYQSYAHNKFFYLLGKTESCKSLEVAHVLFHIVV